MAFSFSKFWEGIKIKAKVTSTVDSVGDLDVTSGNGKLNYHNGTTASPVVTEAHAATLTNKTIAAGSNTVTGIADANIASGAAIDAAKIANASVSNTEFQYLDGVTSAIQTQLDSKQGTGNYISALTGDVAATGPGSVTATIQANAITNAKVAAAAAIARSKLAAGTANRLVVNDVSGVQTDAAAITANRALVSDANGIPTQSATSDTEIGYVAGVTSAIQTQINNKQTLDATLTALAAFNSNGLVTQTAADTFTARTVTGTANQTTVTNGDGVSGNPTIAIASNPIIPGTADITIPSGTTAQRPGSPTAGMIRYNTDINQYEGYTTTWAPIAGSGGSINYVSPSDGSSTTGYAVYADAAQATPVDGTGGSPSSTLASSTDSSLVGTTNLLWTKSANNRQGEGWSYDFTIDSGYQAKPMTLSFLYKIGSGTYVDGDMTCWIYDKTNAVLIQPSAYSILNTTGVATQKCEFQTNSNSTSYRLIVHTASVSALAYTVRFDQVSVSPNTYNSGASISEWTSFTPTYVGFGTVTASTALYRRVGSSMEVLAYLSTGTSSASTFTMAIPAGLSLDFSRLAGSALSQRVGWINNLAAGAKSIVVASQFAPLFVDGTNNFIYAGYASNANAYTKAAGSTLAGNGDPVQINFTVPILGWGVSQVLSSDTDTRVVAAVITGSPPNSYTANNPVIFPTVSQDTHGAYSTVTGKYTAPVSGFYQADVEVYANYAIDTAFFLYIDAVAQSSRLGTLLVSNRAFNASRKVWLNAGQTIDIRANANATTTQEAGYFSISRISGPAQIAASEKVFLQYTGNGGTVLSANVTNIDFTTKVVDSHGAWNGTTFTAPRPGWYNITGSLNHTLSALRDCDIYVNAVQKITAGSAQASTAIYSLQSGIYLNAGDLLTFRSDTAGILSNSSRFHWISISSQG